MAMFSSAPWITDVVMGSMRSGLVAGWRRTAVLMERSCNDEVHAVLSLHWTLYSGAKEFPLATIHCDSRIRLTTTRNVVAYVCRPVDEGRSCPSARHRRENE